VLELLVGCGGGDEEAFLVTCGQATDDSCSGDCGVADGNDVLEFGFEDTGRVLVLRYLSWSVCAPSIWGGAGLEICHTCRSSLKLRLRQSHMRL
jgi:hypothetical protein